jgi:MFS family permease
MDIFDGLTDIFSTLTRPFMGLMFPRYRRSRWRQFRWTRYALVAAYIAPMLGGWLFYFLILRLYQTPVGWLVGIFLPLLGGLACGVGARFLLWHFVVKKQETRPIQVHTPTRAKKNITYPSSYQLSPDDFENEVAWVFEQLYPVQARITGGAGDGGVDVVFYDRQGQMVGIAQCKRYRPGKLLAPTHLRDLDSVRLRSGAAKAYLITTARFSQASFAQAQAWSIHLIDGAEFERLRTEAYRRAGLPLPIQKRPAAAPQQSR